MAQRFILLDLPIQAWLLSSFAIRTDEVITTLYLLPADGKSTWSPATNWLRTRRSDADGDGVLALVSGARQGLRSD